MFYKSVIARLIGMLIFVAVLGTVGYIAYQAGAAGNTAGVELPLGLAGLGALCLGGALFFMTVGALVFVFCPFGRRGRMKSQEFDS